MHNFQNITSTFGFLTYVPKTQVSIFLVSMLVIVNGNSPNLRVVFSCNIKIFDYIQI